MSIIEAENFDESGQAESLFEFGSNSSAQDGPQDDIFDMGRFDRKDIIYRYDPTDTNYQDVIMGAAVRLRAALDLQDQSGHREYPSELIDAMILSQQ